jgi:hypothetical protein
MMTKEYLYDVQQGQDRSGWVSSIEPEPQHPVAGQPVWYISKSGQVWGGTFLERCYLSPEVYKIRDDGSGFNSGHIFKIDACRVYTDRREAFSVAMEEAMELVDQLYSEYEDGYEEALPSRPPFAVPTGGEVWWVDDALSLRHGKNVGGVVASGSVQVAEDTGRGNAVTCWRNHCYLHPTEASALEEIAMRKAWREEITPC